jgi:hypothetical protein
MKALILFMLIGLSVNAQVDTVYTPEGLGWFPHSTVLPYTNFKKAADTASMPYGTVLVRVRHSADYPPDSTFHIFSERWKISHVKAQLQSFPVTNFELLRKGHQRWYKNLYPEMNWLCMDTIKVLNTYPEWQSIECSKPIPPAINPFGNSHAHYTEPTLSEQITWAAKGGFFGFLIIYLITSPVFWVRMVKELRNVV